MAEDRKLSATGIILGALGGCALIILIGIVFLFFAISKTGLTSKSIDIPQPSHTVEAGDKTSDTIKSDLVASVLRSLADGEAQIVISEEMLTVMLRTDLKESSGQEGIDFQSAQVAIVNETLELYIPIGEGDKNTAVIMAIKPILNDGKISMEITEAQLGNLKAPKFLTQIPENMINDLIREQLAKVEGSFQITSMTLEDGAITLSGKISLDSIPGF